MNHAKAYIGTSGWNYRHWRGRFYPEKLVQRKWLSYFAEQFDTAEVNYSFYRIPQVDQIEAWQDDTSRRFRFALKLWRGITHFKKLVRCEDALKSFFQIVDNLDASRRGPILVQLPPQQRKDLDKIKRFIEDLRSATSGRWKVAVEFRNQDWLCDEVYQALDRLRVAVCLHDMADSAPTSQANDASFVYLRRHGPSQEHYQGSYSPQQIRADAKRIHQWLGEGKTVFAYYNNDDRAHAVHNALQLKQLVADLQRS